MKKFTLPALLFAATALAGCWHCPICYEDEWSREPFPGQPKQHIATPDPVISPSTPINPTDIPN